MCRVQHKNSEHSVTRIRILNCNTSDTCRLISPSGSYRFLRETGIICKRCKTNKQHSPVRRKICMHIYMHAHARTHAHSYWAMLDFMLIYVYILTNANMYCIYVYATACWCMRISACTTEKLLNLRGREVGNDAVPSFGFRFRFSEVSERGNEAKLISYQFKQ